jgi:hypothetical protein
MSAATILDAAARDQRPSAKLLRGYIRHIWVDVCLLILLTPLPFVAATLAMAVSGKDRGFGLLAALAIGGVGLGLLPVVLEFALFGAARRPMGVGSWFLRQAAALGDDALVTPVQPQPSPLMESELEGSERSYRDVRWIDDLWRARVSWIAVKIGIILVYLYCCAFAVASALASCATGGSCSRTFPPMLLLLLPAFTVPVMVFAVSSLLSLQQTLVVRADREGLRWRAHPFQAERYVPWSQVRSIMRTSLRTPGSDTPLDIYILDTLDAGDAALSWGYSLPLGRATDREEAESLLRLCLAHTGLVLRDAMPLQARITSDQQAATLFGWRVGAKLLVHTPQAAPIPGLTEALAAGSGVVRRGRILRWLSFVPLAAYIAFCVVGWMA